MQEQKLDLRHMRFSGVRKIYGNLIKETFHPKIAIMEVIEAGTPPGLYETAMEHPITYIDGLLGHRDYGKRTVNVSVKLASVACYAQAQGYDFLIIDDGNFRAKCPQKDKFFRRHCIIAHSLEDYDYVLFLDADIGVVNPERRIEEFLDLEADLVFYDRFYNWEVTAGTYIVKNSHWSKAFLHGFSKFESRIPERDFGSDNGALHAYLVELLLPKSEGLKECMLIYNNSKSYGSLFLFEACIRKILGYGTHFGNVRILRKGTGWARDHRMTNSKWSKDTDFMIHNWKMKYQRIYNSTPIPVEPERNANFNSWYSPFTGLFEMELCFPGNLTWNYDENIIDTSDVIEAQLSTYKEKVEAIKTNVLTHLTELSHMWWYEEKQRIHANLTPIGHTWESYVV